MSGAQSARSAVAHLDELAARPSWLGSLDPRAKLVTTLLYLVVLASFGRTQVGALLPLLLFPVASLALGAVPPRPLLWRMAIASPFAVLVGALNPLLDRAPVFALGPIAVSGGWASFASILLRFLLAASGALLLLATTGFDALCAALARLHVPRTLVVQLLFLHRYLFVLGEEVARTARAVALRSPGERRPALALAGTLLGQILLRTLERAQRLHAAMVCRGFDGEVRLQRTLAARPADALYLTGWCAWFLLCRAVDLPALLGAAALRGAG